MTLHHFQSAAVNPDGSEGSFSHLMHQFAAQVEARPQQDAVRYGDTALTYTELDQLAQGLALQLHGLGASASSYIGVYLRPCFDSVVALLAILKLRAIYVPLDADFPMARLATILDDVRPHVILTDGELATRLTAWGDKVIDIASLDLSIVFDSGIALDSTVQPGTRNAFVAIDLPQAPAYVFYTSGTTGKPKGVVGTQQNLTHYIGSALSQFQTDFPIVMPAIARFTFSISLFELLCPLISGGTLLILDREHILNPPQLAKTLETVTMLHMGPSLFKNMIAYLQANFASFEAFKNLRHVSMGGDIVPPSVLRKLPSIFSNADLFVIYGCSEIACMGCNYRVGPHSRFEKPLVGIPFPGVGLKLLDENLAPAAEGEVGEIYFSGPGVTAGYLNLETLTAQKYVEINGDRYYRTGDLGRVDADNNLEVIGRSDFQVKIRGIRIELGEIETHLLAFAGITDAIVTAIPAGNDERVLCAYIVCAAQVNLDKAQLKQHLGARLPDYMVPMYYVMLDRLPLNHNLKLDRSALPIPDKNDLVNVTDYAPPTNATESTLVAIWEDILQIAGVGTTHNFFDLGGDSLLAARFIVEIEKQFSRHISVAAFLKAPTIREFSPLVLGEVAEETGASDSFVFRHSSGRRVFLMHGALVYRDLAEAIDSDIGACAVFADEEAKLIGVRSTAEVFKIYSSVPAMAQRYYAEVRRLQPEGPYYLAGFSMGGLVTMEVAQMLTKAGCEVAAVFLFDCYLPSFFGKFYWDKVFTNIRKTFSKGLPHLQYVAAQLYGRIAHRRTLQAIHASDAPLDDDDLESVRYLARRNASDHYLPGRYDGRVVLFRAMRRPAIGYVPKDPTLGWKKYLRDLTIHDIDGEHLDILKGEDAKHIATIISSTIFTATAAGGTYTAKPALCAALPVDWKHNEVPSRL